MLKLGAHSIPDGVYIRMNAVVNEQETDRRVAARYAIERDIRWKLRGKRTREAPALGRTVNISSTGALFTTGLSLAAGMPVEVAINWPSPLDGDGELLLIARGRLVRCTDGFAAVQFHQREFQARQSQL